MATFNRSNVSLGSISLPNCFFCFVLCLNAVVEVPNSCFAYACYVVQVSVDEGFEFVRDHNRSAEGEIVCRVDVSVSSLDRKSVV